MTPPAPPSAAPPVAEAAGAASPPASNHGRAKGRIDPAGRARILAVYRRLRPLLGRRGDGAEPSPAERAALMELVGREGGAEAEEGAREGASWADLAAKIWLTHIFEESRAGLVSTVRFGLGPCVGWGSATPSEWTATSCFDSAVLFIEPVGNTALMERCDACRDAPGGEEGECRFERCHLVVEGSFNGKTKALPPHERAGAGDPVALVFDVRRARVGRLAAPMLGLPGGSAPPDGPPLGDGPPWALLWARAAASDPHAPERARAEAARLRAAGHDGVRVLDSRRIPGLWCCSQAVLIDRFERRSQARAAARKLARAGFDGLVVREIDAP